MATFRRARLTYRRALREEFLDLRVKTDEALFTRVCCDEPLHFLGTAVHDGEVHKGA
jgi:hypothetical protein